ncbi:hypothetical protein [Neorhizobium tomejilense]|uniref:hypothetical protein n=1 Tax=Neorhizobium tomejilense TaxID=2093828 RepID=UPI003ECFE346
MIFAIPLVIIGVLLISTIFRLITTGYDLATSKDLEDPVKAQARKQAEADQQRREYYAGILNAHERRAREAHSAYLSSPELKALTDLKINGLRVFTGNEITPEEKGLLVEADNFHDHVAFQKRNLREGGYDTFRVFSLYVNGLDFCHFYVSFHTNGSPSANFYVVEDRANSPVPAASGAQVYNPISVGSKEITLRTVSLGSWPAFYINGVLKGLR